MSAKRNTSDHYSHKAQNAGYPARSVFKLQEIVDRFSVVKTGDRVLDLGAAPGSWSIFLVALVAPRGRVLSVDLSDLSAITNHQKVQQHPQCSICIRGDFLEPEIVDQILSLGPFDVIVSDAAPGTTGNRTIDTTRSAALVDAALEFCSQSLTPGGSFVAKIFQGGEEQALLNQLRASCATARMFKPKACRSESFETYLIGKGWRGQQDG